MIEIEIDSDKSQLNLILKDLCEFFEKREVTIFSGAGISIPSGLPDSKKLIKSIASILYLSAERLNIGTSEERDLLQKNITDSRLERILDLTVSYHGTSILNSILNFESAIPTFNHKACALLAKHRHLSHIITLNFDVLFEKSLQNNNVPFDWHLPLVSRIEYSKNEKSVITITKPHGTLPFGNFFHQDYFLAATLQYAGDHPQNENILAITEIAKESPVLFVCGYANNDWDIFPILSSIPWKRIYWIQHTIPTPTSVLNMLNALPKHPSVLIHGDVRVLFSKILKQLRIEFNEPINENYPSLEPDLTQLKNNSAATAFVAVNLLDGKKNNLYKTLLNQLGNSIQIISDKNLLYRWEKAMAWSFHAHERNPHKAIKRYLKVISSTSQVNKNDLDHLNECVSMYYEYISTLKRPYLNPLLPYDIYQVIKWRKVILQRITIINSSIDNNSIIIKNESKKARALINYYMVDLYHNWAYHFLPFSNKGIKSLIKLIFKRITFLYDRLASNYPDMDWEYRFVRRIEAHLFAGSLLTNGMIEKLLQIRNMFEQTDQAGHLAYTESVLSIIQLNYSDFLKVKSRMLDEYGVATPSGMLRLTLFHKYFWPQTISTWSVLKSFLNYSKQKK